MDYVWSPSSVVEIAGRTGVSLECLEQECSLEVLHGVSHLCEPWEGMGKGLNLSEREISIIGFKHRNDNEELRMALLERWKELLDYNATYWKLMEAFLFSGIVRGAQEVCRLLKTNGDQKSALEMEGVIHFRFHSVTGKNIALSSDGLEARRKRVGDGADAVVMGAKPLIGSAKLEVEVLSISNMHQGMGSIQIGVMQCKSGTEFEQSDIPCHAEFGNSYCVLWKSFIWNSLGDRMTTCKYGSLNLYNVNQGDRVGMGITNEGDLLFFLNGKSHGVGVWNVCREGFDLYPVVDVANACAAVRITTAGMLRLFNFHLFYIIFLMQL